MGGFHSKSHKNVKSRSEERPVLRHNYRAVGQKKNRRTRFDPFELWVNTGAAFRNSSSQNRGITSSTPCLSVAPSEPKRFDVQSKTNRKYSHTPPAATEWSEVAANPKKYKQHSATLENNDKNRTKKFARHKSSNGSKLKSGSAVVIAEAQNSGGLEGVERNNTVDSSLSALNVQSEGVRQLDDHSPNLKYSGENSQQTISAMGGDELPQMPPKSPKINRKRSPKEAEKAVNNSRDLSTGDTRVLPSPTLKSKQQCAYICNITKPCLVEKPPTPPPKIVLSRPVTPVMQNSNLAVRSSPQRKTFGAANIRHSKSSRLSNLSYDRYLPTSRASSLPRPSTADQWLGTSSADSFSGTPLNMRRPSSLSQPSDGDTSVERPHCLSRIEYTFYINDTEAYQRPFFDRRVEAIARASQCNICLHKPPPGHKPVYYKGMRVLPVTISARTMISLKRCMARLDMQYPYFNVKAFCPPDMY
ncbi:unnamed protein product [Calicophoron daubneyi]|uniref:Uncharacterized protein n=1 Tax=Calicophoron daubneyi TaxID=300641 RepID=A0AAV2T322_CALDB